MIVLSKNKQSLHAFNFFCHDWQVSSLTHILNYLKQHSSQWNSITKSTKLHDFVTRLSGFTFKQQISKIFHNILPYSITFQNLNYPNCHIIAKKKKKKNDIHWQLNYQEVTMLRFDHFSLKTDFFKLQLFLVCFTYLISSSQNFMLHFYKKLTKV